MSKKIRNTVIFSALALGGSLCGLAAIRGVVRDVDVQASSTAQKTSEAQGEKPLVLRAEIPIEGVKGRLDHLASGKGMLFVSALGNNTVEVIDLTRGRVTHSITGIPAPQGLAYSPEANKLFVASDEGKLFIYDANSFNLITSIEFDGGADNLRYDASTKHVYVACGDDEKSAAIAVVDAVTNQRLPEEYKLGGEPESFQLEKTGPHIYVNVPDLKQIVVIDRATKEINRWPVSLGLNFPMALDEADHRLFVGTRVPSRLAVFDTNSGRMIAALPSIGDMDDLFYDSARKRVYMSGGEGAIDVFQMTDPDHFHRLDRVPSALGARTSGYYGKQNKGFDFFYVAVPNRTNRDAEVLVYMVQD